MSVARLMQQAAAGSAGAGPEPSGWTDPDLGNASYDSVSFSVAGQEVNPFGMSFKSDGTALYVIGTTGDDVNQYSLGTAWDISTATFVQIFSVAAQETAPTSVFFKPDGTKMYVAGQGSDAVNEYSISTAWDVSTSSYVQNFSIFAQESAIFGLFFKPDGTKMYVAGTSGDDVNEYNLGTAWDVSTASFLQASSVLSEVVSLLGLFFSPNGDYFYVTDNNSNDVSEYSLSTNWDVSTASYVQNFSVSSQITQPRELFFKSDGSKMYVADGTTDTIYQYSTA